MGRTTVQQAGGGVKQVEHLGLRVVLNKCSTGVQQVFNSYPSPGCRTVDCQSLSDVVGVPECRSVGAYALTHGVHKVQRGQDEDKP